MKYPKNILISQLFSLLFFITACGNSQPLPPKPQNTPDPANVVGTATVYETNLAVRLDHVNILETPVEFGTNEVFFSILVVRPEYPSLINSGKLSLPLSGTISDVKAGDTILLESVGIYLSDVKPDETIYVYLLGFEDDANMPQSYRKTADVMLAATMSLLLEAVPMGGVANFVINQGIGQMNGELLDWWQEADLLGEFAVSINRGDESIIGKQSHGISDNGQLEFFYSLIPTTELVTEEYTIDDGVIDDSDTASLTILNKSNIIINQVFIAPIASETLGPAIETEIKPSDIGTFIIPNGEYKVRIIGEDTTWEERVDINGDTNLEIGLLTE